MRVLLLSLLLIALSFVSARDTVRGANHFHPHGKHLQAFGLPEHVAELRTVSTSPSSPKVAKAGKKRTMGGDLGSSEKHTLTALDSAAELLAKNSAKYHVSEILKEHTQAVNDIVQAMSLQEIPPLSDVFATSSDGWLLYSFGDTCFGSNPLLWQASLLSNCYPDGNQSHTYSNCIPGQSLTVTQYSDRNCTTFSKTVTIPFYDTCMYNSYYMTNLSVTCAPMTNSSEFYPSQISGEYLAQR